MQRGVQRADQSRRDCRTALLALLTTSTLTTRGWQAWGVLQVKYVKPASYLQLLGARTWHPNKLASNLDYSRLRAHRHLHLLSSSSQCTPTTRGQAHAKHLSCEIHLFLLAECPSGHNFDKSCVHVRPNADPHADKNVPSARKTSRRTRAARGFTLSTRRRC